MGLGPGRPNTWNLYPFVALTVTFKVLFNEVAVDKFNLGDSESVAINIKPDRTIEFDFIQIIDPLLIKVGYRRLVKAGLTMFCSAGPMTCKRLMAASLKGRRKGRLRSFRIPLVEKETKYESITTLSADMDQYITGLWIYEDEQHVASSRLKIVSGANRPVKHLAGF